MKLPALLDELASFGIHDRATWEVISRKLRDAEDIARSKRGRGAEHVDPVDCATLIIAGLTTSTPAGASDAVRKFREMERAPRWEMPRARIRGLREMMSSATFGDAIDALMLFGDTLEPDIKKYSSRLIKRLGGLSEQIASMLAKAGTLDSWSDHQVTLFLNIECSPRRRALLYLSEPKGGITSADALCSIDDDRRCLAIWTEPFRPPGADEAGITKTITINNEALMRLAGLPHRLTRASA